MNSELLKFSCAVLSNSPYTSQASGYVVLVTDCHLVVGFFDDESQTEGHAIASYDKVYVGDIKTMTRKTLDELFYRC